jgi:hypothetical protein
MRRTGRFLERVIQVSDGIREAFARLGFARGRRTGWLTGERANHRAKGVGIDPALLQNLVRHGPDLVSDGLVFPGPGVSRRPSWLTHGLLPG